MDTKEFNEYREKAVKLLAKELKNFYFKRFQSGTRFFKVQINGGTAKVTLPWTDLYIRISTMRDGERFCVKLVIARISFREERSGHGTALVAHLAQVASHIGHEYIEIESVNDASRAFAIHLGMHEHVQDCYIASVPDLLKVTSVKHFGLDHVK